MESEWEKQRDVVVPYSIRWPHVPQKVRIWTERKRCVKQLPERLKWWEREVLALGIEEEEAEEANKAGTPNRQTVKNFASTISHQNISTFVAIYKLFFFLARTIYKPFFSSESRKHFTRVLVLIHI